MQSKLSSMLFRGALTAAALVTSAGGIAVPLSAQTAATVPSENNRPLEAALSYRVSWAQLLPGSTFAMQGGSAQIHYAMFRGLGIAADFSGAHTSNINSTSNGLDLITALFGPRYTWIPRHQRKYALYGQALAGEAWGFNSIFPSPPASVLNSSNSLAVEAGGGLNVAISPHWKLRAFEVDWLYTQFPNSASNRQSNAQFGTGLIYRFR